MKKLLYIIASSKPEPISASRMVGRALVNRILQTYGDFVLEEVNLYEVHLPRPKYSYFSDKSTLVNAEELAKLNAGEQQDVRQMEKLCNQFVSASVYVVSAPMWSLSFPAPFKDYIDCVVQAEKTISFKDEKPQGLLNDMPRTFIYVQSSGANIPWIVKPAFNKGLNYVEDIMKYIGIAKFEDLLVDGTGTTEQEKQQAIQKAEKRIDEIIEAIKF